MTKAELLEQLSAALDTAEIRMANGLPVLEVFYHLNGKYVFLATSDSNAYLSPVIPNKGTARPV